MKLFALEEVLILPLLLQSNCYGRIDRFYDLDIEYL